jgi:hypothetical protein
VHRDFRYQIPHREIDQGEVDDIGDQQREMLATEAGARLVEELVARIDDGLAA